MTNYIVLSDGRDVLGVWCSTKSVRASRWGLELSLTYPGCDIWVEAHASFDDLKMRHPDLDFAAHRPEPIGSMLRTRAPSSPAWPVPAL